MDLQIWQPAVEGPSVLLLDSLKTHKMASVRASLEDCYTEPEFVPPGITGLAQPMDLSVMHMFKKKTRELYVLHHVENDFCETAPQRRSLITNIVLSAWESISPDVIRRGFVKAGLIPVGPRPPDGSFFIDKPVEEEQQEDEED